MKIDIQKIDFHEIKDSLITVCDTDVIIKRFVQTFSYYKKTEDENVGWDKTPSPKEVDKYLNELIDYLINEIQKGEYSTDLNIFDLNTNIGKILFLKEELIKHLCFVICVVYGESSTEEGINHEIERELKQITIDENVGFLENVYNNVVSKRRMMELVAPTLFLSNFIEEDEIKNIDYDLFVETTPIIIKLVFETSLLVKSSLESYYTPIDDYEEVNENNVRNFISFMVDEIRKTNTDFCQELSSGLIVIGRAPR